MGTSSEFAQRLRRLRTMTGFTATSFAEYACIRPCTYYCWERGDHMPREENIRRILRCLGNLSGRRIGREELVGDG